MRSGSNSVVECQLPKLKVAGSNPVSRSPSLPEPSPHRSAMRISVRYLCLFVLLTTVLSLPACRPKPLEHALAGRIEPVQGNRVITEYCQSCHIHRTFDSTTHVSQAQVLYDREPFSTTGQCRTCHLVSKNTWGVHKRKTIWPAEAGTGQHKPLKGLKWLKDLF